MSDTPRAGGSTRYVQAGVTLTDGTTARTEWAPAEQMPTATELVEIVEDPRITLYTRRSGARIQPIEPGLLESTVWCATPPQQEPPPTRGENQRLLILHTTANRRVAPQVLNRYPLPGSTDPGSSGSHSPSTPVPTPAAVMSRQAPPVHPPQNLPRDVVRTPANHPVLPAAMGAALEFGCDPERVDAIIAHPRLTWSARDNRTFLSDGEFDLLVTSSGLVLRIAPAGKGDYETTVPQQSEIERRAQQEQRRRAKSSASSERYRLPTDTAEFIEHCAQYGITARLSGSDHYHLEHPDRTWRRVTIPATSSDYRWAQNAASLIRRELGIDIRTRPED